MASKWITTHDGTQAFPLSDVEQFMVAPTDSFQQHRVVAIVKGSDYRKTLFISEYKDDCVKYLRNLVDA